MLNEQDRLSALKERERQLSKERHKHYTAISHIDYELMKVREELKGQGHGGAKPRE